MILIGTDEGIYRWVEGSGWPVYHGLQDRAVVALATGGPGVLAAADRTGALLESTDTGLTWSDVALPEGAGTPAGFCVGGKGREVVLATRSGAYFRRGVGTPAPRARDLDTSTWVGRARTLAEGATVLLAPKSRRPAATAEAIRLAGWTPTGAPSTTAASSVRLAWLPGDTPVWLTAAAGAGLSRSTDSGKTWSKVDGLAADVHALRPVPGRPGEVWAATADGCRFSGDAGQTWEDRSSGLEKARNVRAIAVKPDEPATLLAAAAASEPKGPDALYESTNSGKTWAPVVKRNFPVDLTYDTISDIRHDPAAPDCVLIALGSGELWATRNGGAYWGPLARQTKSARVLCGIG
ncbi:MAG: hypothetical protein U0835_26365 [Isosphaeraceae bacterium]